MTHALFRTLLRCQHLLERLLKTRQFLELSLNFTDPWGTPTLALELAVRVRLCKGGFVFSIPFARLVVIVMRLVAPITHIYPLGYLVMYSLKVRGGDPTRPGSFRCLRVTGCHLLRSFPWLERLWATEALTAASATADAPHNGGRPLPKEGLPPPPRHAAPRRACTPKGQCRAPAPTRTCPRHIGCGPRLPNAPGTGSAVRGGQAPFASALYPPGKCPGDARGPVLGPPTHITHAQGTRATGLRALPSCARSK